MTEFNPEAMVRCDVMSDEISKLREQLYKVNAYSAKTREENKRLREVMSDLLALVIGECPSLLNEDSGGDARLYLACKSALRRDI